MSESKDMLLEFVFQGNSVKVTAIDSPTGEEASIIGPASARRADLEAAAARKLQYGLRPRGPQ